MEILTTGKYLRTSPTKVNRVIKEIVGMKVDRALIVLKFMPTKPARILYNIVKSAKANAVHNYQMDESKLVISEGFTGQALIMKRFRAASRGKAARIQKKYAHVSIRVKEGN